jgi:ribonuclease P protein subunit RPR2
MGVRAQNQAGKKIARERIQILLERACALHHTEPEESLRCIVLARRISMRLRVRIPKDLRRLFCRRCLQVLVPGESGRVRIHRGKVIVTCRACGRQKRYPVVRAHRT